MVIQSRGTVRALAALILAAAGAPDVCFAGEDVSSLRKTSQDCPPRAVVFPVRVPRVRDVAKRAAQDADPEIPTAEEVLADCVRVLEKGTSSGAERRAALSSVSLDKLKKPDRERVERILNSADMFRSLPRLEFEVEPGVYRFFAHNPDVAVAIWRVMDISKFDVRQTGNEQYFADSGDGTRGRLEFLYRSDRESLVICEGLYKSPFLPKKIKAQALLHFETELTRRDDGTPVARHVGRMFVAFPSQAVGTVARIVSPVSHFIMDRNFREVSLFVHMMSLAMQKQPAWVEHLARRMEGVKDSQKTELLKLTAHVYLEARKRKLARSLDRDDVSLNDLAAPLREAAGRRGTAR